MGIIPERKPFIQPLKRAWYGGRVQDVSMLRLDVIHPIVSGNKWYKLKENILYCLRNGYDTILTFGGGYSNHLVATAKAAQYYGLNAVGIVRGDYRDNPTPTLRNCKNYGMIIKYVSYDEYKKKDDESWQKELSNEYSCAFIIPEGGDNDLGRKGAEEIANYIPEEFTHVCVSVGSGTIYAGVLKYMDKEVRGYAPMKGGAYLKNEIVHIEDLSGKKINITDAWHFGGFGKHTDELIYFMNDFHEINNIPLDVVYTSKMMYGVREQIKKGFFPEDAKILCIHTGGLQGNSTLRDRLSY